MHYCQILLRRKHKSHFLIFSWTRAVSTKWVVGSAASISRYLFARVQTERMRVTGDDLVIRTRRAPWIMHWPSPSEWMWWPLRSLHTPLPDKSVQNALCGRRVNPRKKKESKVPPPCDACSRIASAALILPQLITAALHDRRKARLRRSSQCEAVQ